MSSAIANLLKCGDIQRDIFFGTFLNHQKVGEMICVNDENLGDSYLFERWSIHGIDFVACFRLLSEDSLVVHDIGYSYTSHEIFLELKSQRQLQLYNQFIEKLTAEGKTVEEVKSRARAQGKDPELFNYVPFTREVLEERLPPGKKTIMGDRHTTIEVLERQKEIPHDLQRPRLNRYLLEPSASILALLALSEESTLQEDCRLWRRTFLADAPRGIKLSTTLPFLVDTIEIVPEIYAFPDKELQVE